MAICITFGTHEFTSQLQGYENVTAQCQNCGNWSGRCITRWPFFTVCFIPVIPLAMHKYKEVYCHICRFSQDLSMRPDVQSQGPGGQNQGQGQGPPPGGPPHYGPPPGQQGPYQQYQPPQQPGYK
ncbi:hypothetical protein MGYG_07414 [Nannizzia gypsea CBS 118893]|uniref:Rhodopsin family protein n=1 Tax=Arthroderma gypseum (strain ATCC MYA-4604 / CBS 118893) TaxID=535722 RepID=E4V334_ARTGP|nr:hypothetical protein MGYG_07414 [Nannizzia gypsea CBS 118893]EFR04408.1 hypothetical protein MGYG_07414 [Nannizzia gypsea CBS 118893]